MLIFMSRDWNNKTRPCIWTEKFNGLTDLATLWIRMVAFTFQSAKLYDSSHPVVMVPLIVVVFFLTNLLFDTTVILGLPFDLPNVARKMKWKSFRTTTEANMHTGWKVTSWVHEVVMRMMMINDFFCLFVYLSIYISWFYVVGGRHMFLHSKWHWTVVRAVVFRRLWGM